MNMEMNLINHNFGTGDTTDIRIAGADPKFEAYKSKMTEKMFVRFVDKDPDEKLIYKSVRAINFMGTIYRITISNVRGSYSTNNPICRVEKMTINGWVTILDEDDLNIASFREFKIKLNLIFKVPSHIDKIQNKELAYSMMDDIELDFITTIILLFND